MAYEQNDSSQSAERELRPVIITDENVLRWQDAVLRHCFVGLTDEACKAALLCPADTELGQITASPVDIVQYPPLLSMGLWKPVISPLIDKLQKIEPTVLHCIAHSKLRLTQKLSGLLNIPFVVSLNSCPTHSLRHMCTAGCSGIIVPSRSIAVKAKAMLHDKSDMVRCIRVGTFVSEKIACFAGAGGLVTIVIVHPLDRCSDFEPVFNAVKHLCIDGVELVVALMGSGKAEGKVRKLISDLGLGNVVNIVPEMRPLRQVFSGADIFLKPKCSGDFDFALLDAMSEGMAVAACKGNDDELLQAGQTAALFDEDDQVSIYTTLAALIRQKDYSRNLAAEAQNLLRREYRVSRMVTEIIEMYRQVIAAAK